MSDVVRTSLIFATETFCFVYTVYMYVCESNINHDFDSDMVKTVKKGHLLKTRPLEN